MGEFSVFTHAPGLVTTARYLLDWAGTSCLATEDVTRNDIKYDV